MKVWVLVDDKVGSSKQAVALAETLGLNYFLKPINYTLLARLPNFVPGLRYVAISGDTKKALLDDGDIPDVVIGAGRRLALVMSYLKSVYPKSKFIQILKPDLPLKYFDALVLPEHDIIKLTPLDNRKKIVRINGAVTWHDPQEMEGARTLWEPHFSYLPKPYIAVLVGGNARGCRMEQRHATELVKRTVELANQLGASLLVSNSRRTDRNISRHIFHGFANSGIPCHLYDALSALDNPYKGYLACADYMVVTGDSISMCVESMATGRPVIVYCTRGMVSKKHWRFVERLISESEINMLQTVDPENLILPKNKNTALKKRLFAMLEHKR